MRSGAAQGASRRSQAAILPTFGSMTNLLALYADAWALLPEEVVASVTVTCSVPVPRSAAPEPEDSRRGVPVATPA